MSGRRTIGPEDLAYDDEVWFARADAALYRAKSLGRNLCEIDLRSVARSRPVATVMPRRGQRTHPVPDLPLERPTGLT